MSVTNFIPTIWAAVIMQERDKVLVARQICNTAYEGDVRQAGDQVKFPGLMDPSVNPYTGTVSYEDVQDAALLMTIDQKYYFAVQLDDVDAAQAKKGLLQALARRAGQKLAETADAFVLAKYSEAPAANIVTDANCDTSTILSDITQAGRLLDDNNAPSEGRWMVIPPWIKEKLVLAGVKFSINQGAPIGSGLQWAQHNNFNLYVSNNVTNPTASTGHVSYGLAGSRDAIAYADQLLKTEALRRDGSFKDAVRGLHIYGAKVLRPKELVSLALTYAAETAI